MGLSAMMHGYLAFDRNWNLLVPFRTWQNTMTAQAAAELSELFRFNIPQRWSVAHLYLALASDHVDVGDPVVSLREDKLFFERSDLHIQRSVLRIQSDLADICCGIGFQQFLKIIK